MKKWVADGFVIRADVRGVHSGEVAVDENVWNVARLHALKDFERRGRLRGSENETIDLASEKPIDLAEIFAGLP